ncbi:hypothetical protein [Labilithrix luteola]|uniref:hypothetical protein n=1 Tax=Labilithrix luteola TaxID=1391654 RepID=UPI001F0A38B1|nr:hypothetical protein [Labilithrix luteola]
MDELLVVIGDLAAREDRVVDVVQVDGAVAILSRAICVFVRRISLWCSEGGVCALALWLQPARQGSKARK